MLQSRAEPRTVENVVVLIADSLRYDSIPDSVASRGVLGETIAPSTFTATSVPSIVTGQYPIDHHVWGFGERLADHPLLFDSFEHSGWAAHTFGNVPDPTDKGVFQVMNLPSSTLIPEPNSGLSTPSYPLSALDPPFLYVEHHHGGHAVYGDPLRDERVAESDVRAYCSEIGGSDDRLREHYRRGAEAAGRRFKELRDRLADRGILGNTLLLFTSDHGEGLGESGVVSHGAPMVPAVLRVPTVFAGAGIESDNTDRLLSGVDIVPTVLSATGHDIPRSLPGCDLWRESPDSDRTVAAQQSVSFGRGSYRAAAVFNETGGRIRQYGSRTDRLWSYGLDLFGRQSSPLVYHRPLRAAKLLAVYLRREAVYGATPPTPDELPPPDAFDREVETGVTDVPTEHLEDLGYLEQS